MQKIPTKRFSQNFLQDQGYINQIVAAVAPTAGDKIIEIGPGLGALTEPLLQHHIQLHAIEVDNQLIPILKQKFAKQQNFVLHHQDVLQFNFANLVDEELSCHDKYKVIGNLPYNISTPIIFKLLSSQHIFNYMIFMLQEEVVDRLCAAPGNKIYGKLSVMTQYHCKTEKLFTVPANVFYPVPKVTSAVIKLTPHASNPCTAKDYQMLESIVSAAFNQRRKTIANSLKKIVSKETILAAEIDLAARADDIGLAQFVRLANLTDS